MKHTLEVFAEQREEKALKDVAKRMLKAGENVDKIMDFTKLTIGDIIKLKNEMM